jgi:murein DD-endopeptidase MepM/ murein hydrolase activator NlpD
MVIPHSEQNVSEFRFSLSQIKFAIYGLCGSVTVIAAVVLLLAVGFFSMRENMAELKDLRTINKAQATQLDKLADTTGRLEAKLIEIESLETDVRGMLNLTKDDRQSVTPSRSQDTALPGTTTSKKKGLSRVEEIKNLEAHAAELIGAAESYTVSMRQLSKAVAYAKAKEAAKPRIAPTYGRFTSGFGFRTNPRTAFHSGVDIANKKGTPIKAAADGTVEFAGTRNGYGLTIVINHGFGYKTLYGHTSEMLVKAGDKVKCGQVIAKMGSTGYSTGSHLHYEVFVNGENVDPQKFY